MIKVKKLYITIPEELFNKIKEERLFPEIDNIIINLLTDYFERQEEA